MVVKFSFTHSFLDFLIRSILSTMSGNRSPLYLFYLNNSKIRHRDAEPSRRGARGRMRGRAAHAPPCPLPLLELKLGFS